MKNILIVLSMFTSLVACSSNDNDVKLISNKEKAVELLNSIETGDKKAVEYINPSNYKQHNLSIADGLAGFGEALSFLPEGSAKVNIVRSFEDGDFVFIQTEYNFFGPKAGFDIFRFEEGLIVEHWDNLTAISKPNPSGRTQFDGYTNIEDLEQTEKNKTLVANFVNTILVKGEMNKLASFFDGDNYIQHNSGIADGLSGLGKALGELDQAGISMIYDEVHMVMGEGNFVLVVSEGSFGNNHTAYYDLFRVQNGKIAEHWDILETIIPAAERKNKNGKF